MVSCKISLKPIHWYMVCRIPTQSCFHRTWLNPSKTVNISWLNHQDGWFTLKLVMENQFNHPNSGLNLAKWKQLAGNWKSPCSTDKVSTLMGTEWWTQYSLQHIPKHILHYCQINILTRTRNPHDDRHVIHHYLNQECPFLCFWWLPEGLREWTAVVDNVDSPGPTFRVTFSGINHSAIGVSPFMETPNYSSTLIWLSDPFQESPSLCTSWKVIDL